MKSKARTDAQLSAAQTPFVRKKITLWRQRKAAERRAEIQQQHKAAGNDQKSCS
jgi:hypothetical protein